MIGIRKLSFPFMQTIEKPLKLTLEGILLVKYAIVNVTSSEIRLLQNCMLQTLALLSKQLGMGRVSGVTPNMSVICCLNPIFIPVTNSTLLPLKTTKSLESKGVSFSWSQLCTIT